MSVSLNFLLMKCWWRKESSNDGSFGFFLRISISPSVRFAVPSANRSNAWSFHDTATGRSLKSNRRKPKIVLSSTYSFHFVSRSIQHLVWSEHEPRFFRRSKNFFLSQKTESMYWAALLYYDVECCAGDSEVEKEQNRSWARKLCDGGNFECSFEL